MSRVFQKLAVGGVTGLVLIGSVLGCGSTGGQPDGGHPGGCASACTLQLTGDNDGDDSTEVPGGQESFNCDDAPIATWVVGSGAVPSSFNFIIGRSGSPDISVDLTLAAVPTAGTSYAGTTTEVAYLVTGSSAGPAFFSDPAINGSSTFVFCSVEAGQATGGSITYTVHGTVDAVLEPYQPPSNEAPESITFHAQF
jgi:hypothetical protein